MPMQELCDYRERFDPEVVVYDSFYVVDARDNSKSELLLQGTRMQAEEALTDVPLAQLWGILNGCATPIIWPVK